MSPLHPPPSLPALTQTPTRHPASCLTLSFLLINTLTTLLAPILHDPDHAILSVGSGSGLLEALLLANDPSLRLMGIELPGVNRYLQQAIEMAIDGDHALGQERSGNLITVPGTWSIVRPPPAAWVLMFVYPREPELVRRYVDAYSAYAGDGEEGGLKVVIWLGPRVDWEEGFKQCFVQGDKVGCRGGFEGVKTWEGGEIGVADYEMMAVLRRKDEG